jgi:hypothetical protein
LNSGRRLAAFSPRTERALQDEWPQKTLAVCSGQSPPEPLAAHQISIFTRSGTGRWCHNLARLNSLFTSTRTRCVKNVAAWTLLTIYGVRSMFFVAVLLTIFQSFN